MVPICADVRLDGWFFLGDLVTVNGTLDHLTPPAGIVGGNRDCDWSLHVKPQFADRDLLRNHKHSLNENGLIECEIKPPNTLKGGLDATNPDTMTRFFAPYVGRRVSVNGTWVADKGHNDKTEIHPIRAVRFDEPSPHGLSTTTRITLFMFSDAATRHVPRNGEVYPHINESRKVTYAISFPPHEGVEVGQPIVRVLEEIDMAASKSMKIVQNPPPHTDQFHLEYSVTTGRPSDGKGFYYVLMDLSYASGL